VRIAPVLAAVLATALVADARTPLRRCKAACRDAITSCVAQGTRRKACRKTILRRCRRSTVEACAVAAPTTTTLAPDGGTTTTSTIAAGPSVNGCDAAVATDRRGLITVVVEFADFAYTPACVLVDPGARVRFTGDFARHPLVGGAVVDGVAQPDPASPFDRHDTGTARTWSMAGAGTFGYYCDAHAALGMAGAVVVAPGGGRR
jgi:plastocyanin